MEEEVDDPSSVQKHNPNEKGGSKKKITIIVDEDDPCLKKKDHIHKEEVSQFRYSPGNDPRYIIEIFRKFRKYFFRQRHYPVVLQISTAKSDAEMLCNVYRFLSLSAYFR